MTLSKYSTKHVFLLPALYIAYTLVLTFIAEPLLGTLSGEDNNLLIILAVPGHILLSGYVLFTIGRGSLLNDELKLLFRWRDLLPGILFGIITLATSTIMSLFLPVVQSAGHTFVFKGFGPVLILYMFFISFVAPLIEELVFRGFLWKILEEKGINKYLILLITSLLFAAFHMDLYKFPVLLTGGIIYGFLRIKTGHTSRSMVAHMANNFLIAIMMFVVPYLL